MAATHTSFPGPFPAPVLRPGVLVIVLIFIVVLTALGYPPELALGMAGAAAAISGTVTAAGPQGLRLAR